MKYTVLLINEIRGVLCYIDNAQNARQAMEAAQHAHPEMSAVVGIFAGEHKNLLYDFPETQMDTSRLM